MVDPRNIRSYKKAMAIAFDPKKRAWTLAERGLDFLDAQIVFDGETVDFEDTRHDYGEHRFICYGHLVERMVVIAWTPRGADRHVFSMRKANDREQERYRERLGEG